MYGHKQVYDPSLGKLFQTISRYNRRVNMLVWYPVVSYLNSVDLCSV